MKKTNQIGALFLSVLIMLQAFPASAPAEGSAEYRAPEKFWSVSFGEKTYLVEDGYTISEFPDPPQEEGKLFLGWYDGDTKVEPPFTPEGDVKLTPRFEDAGPEDQRTLEFSVEGGAVVSLTGLFPEDCTLYVTDEQQPLPIKFMAYRRDAGPDLSAVELYTYNITLRNPDGTEFQPEGKPVTVTIRGSKFEEALGQGRSIHVIHVVEEGKTDEITDLSVHKDQVSFSVDHFSEFRFMGQYDLADWEEKLETDDVTVSLSGLMPLGAEAEAVSAAPELEEGELLAAADISLFNSGVSVQPASWKGMLTVRMSSEAITQAVKAGDDIAVYHAEADGTMTRLEEEAVKLTDEGVEFTADAFSVYVVAGDSMETTIVAGDGNTYKITLTFKEDAVLPDGAALKAEELTGEAAEDYLGRTAVFMNAGGFAYGRVFDISIVDGEGTTVQPEAAVEVSIELLDAPESAGSFSVVHFAEEYDASSETGTYERAETVAAETEGNTVSFAAESFSAYAIVTGLEPVQQNWHQVSSISDLIARSAQGLYVGNPEGFYFGNTIVSDSKRKGIIKTKPAQSYPPTAEAAKYYFEQVTGTDNQVYAYCLADDGTTKQYVYNGGNNSLSFTTDAAAKTAFTVTQTGEGVFMLNNGAWYWNMQGGTNGARFCCYNDANDLNNRLNFWYRDSYTSDPYDLDGKSYGLLNWEGGLTGKALMADPVAGSTNALKAMALTVMTKTGDQGDKLYVPDNVEEDIFLWTFHWQQDDQYTLSTVVDGSTKYLSITSDGLSLVDSPDGDSCLLQVIPGAGNNKNQICLVAGDNSLTYSGKFENGFTVGGRSGKEWLYLISKASDELPSDYFRVFSAEEVSVSDTEKVTNGSRIIIYCRVWNEDLKRYDFYAVDHDGTLVRCFESGSELQWVGGQLNSMLWNLVEYYWEGTTDPNYYYELYNQYDEHYIAPQVSDGQIFSSETVGINLTGRKNGTYYTTIAAWDDAHYGYACLKADAETGKIISIPLSEASAAPEAVDFGFALVKDLPVDDNVSEVSTVDHKKYGITMKIVDLDNVHDSINGYMNSFLGSKEGGAVTTLQQGLLSTDLGNDGYPVAVQGSNQSLGVMFAQSREVNHLFLQSVYGSTGYFMFDSTQNFASLQGSNFVVYQELATHDASSKPTLKHGQFFPFNNIEAGKFASSNPENLYSATAQLLPESNPRKYERLYLINQPDYYFGVELEASFVQTPDGLDAWGHDIIYEFTGDDDFWLYLDGELIIDLGGIHSAVPGTVNYRTGKVNVNGRQTTIRDLIRENYRNRGQNPADVDDDYGFILNEEGNYVFRDNSTHTMRIFYLERGAGASNLYMRFNLASVRPGTVQLTKKLDGLTDSQDVLFPYQIRFKMNENDATDGELLQRKQFDEGPNKGSWNVTDKNTGKPIKYEESYRINDKIYEHVFFLRPGQVAEIDFYGEYLTDVYYNITECGVNINNYDVVKVNGEEVEGTPVAGYTDICDFDSGYKYTSERATVEYTNHVHEKRKLTITKVLRDNGIVKEGYYAEENTPLFNFRLNLGTEYDGATPTYMGAYYILNERSEYCRWDEPTQRFVSFGVTDFDSLTDAQKRASFNTSIYGAITKIPPGYHVEVRNVLPNTRYIVEERPSEIPDGYYHVKYRIKEGDQPIQNSTDYPSGTIVNQDVEVIVENNKGFGLRVNKTWADADYMDSRDSVFFAVYHVVGSGLELVDGSVREMPYKKTAGVNTAPDPQTVYWYYRYEDLPDGVEQYVVREVKLTGVVDVDSDGKVTSYDTIEVINDGQFVELLGKRKDMAGPERYTYTVQYKSDTTIDNVRTFEVNNDIQGIILKKVNENGAPLAGAAFTLTNSEGQPVGSQTYISDANGLITEAFLPTDADYYLTEISSPDHYRGLQAPVKIRIDSEHGEQVNIETSPADSDFVNVAQRDGTEQATVTVINRPYTFKAVKTDAKTGLPLPGVHFALHKQTTDGSSTQFKPEPEEGFEDLLTGTDGVIPKINEQELAAGTYQLRELNTAAAPIPEGYISLSSHVTFTISKTGNITMGTPCPTDVVLLCTETSQTYAYEMTIPNHPVTNMVLKKYVTGNMGDLSCLFPFAVKVDGITRDEAQRIMIRKRASGGQTPAAVTWSPAAEGETTGSATAAISLKDSDVFDLMNIPMGSTVTVSEEIPSGLDYCTAIGTARTDGPITTKDRVKTIQNVQAGETIVFTNYANVTVDTGILLDSVPYWCLFSIALLGLAGVISRRRRKAGD